MKKGQETSSYVFFTHLTLVVIIVATIVCAAGYRVYAGVGKRQGAIIRLSTAVETSTFKPAVSTENGVLYSDNAVSANDAGLAEQWQIVRMRVTAYCPCEKCCGRYSDGITACGHKISHGDRFVAADRKHAFGTEMIIPGYNGGEAVEVLDRGGAIQGDKLDVFFNSHAEALEWGVQLLDVQIRCQ